MSAAALAVLVPRICHMSQLNWFLGTVLVLSLCAMASIVPLLFRQWMGS